jgi:riboflavin biosynthesis pyrimidine reductase
LTADGRAANSGGGSERMAGSHATQASRRALRKDTAAQMVSTTTPVNRYARSRGER